MSPETTAEPTTRGSTRRPRTAANGAAPLFCDGADTAVAMPRHRSSAAGHPSAIESPWRAISRLAASAERSGGGVDAVTTLEGLLHDLPGTATADIAACLEDLCRDLTRCFARAGAPRLSCSCAAHQLPTGTVITLGLIADLLVTNAYAFGFVPPAGGRIAVSFAALEESFELTIEDSGLIRPDTAQGRATAVAIARLLVGELGGWLETPRAIGGSRCIITVPRQKNVGHADRDQHGRPSNRLA